MNSDILNAALELSAARGPLNTSPPRGADADVIEATPGCPQSLQQVGECEMCMATPCMCAAVPAIKEILKEIK